MFPQFFSHARCIVKHGAIFFTFFLITNLSIAGAPPNFANPYPFTSTNGVLNLLMVARAEPIYNLTDAPGGGNPIGWVFDVCYRPADGSNTCPAGSDAVNSPGGLYGGNWLQINPGDTLNIHFVNRLPMITNSIIGSEPGFAYLTMNPTNIHVHGMLVSPRVPSADNPTYGDYVLVYTFNSANGKAVPTPHLHADIRYDYTDYSYKIPQSHPSGQFWIHPHVHGISTNQVSAGMSNLITVGSVNKYVTIPYVPNPSNITDYMVLRDTQVLSNGLINNQLSPPFCSPLSPGNGFCPGQNNTGTGGADFTGGFWYHTINGLQYPTINVSNEAIFALTNASSNRPYNLNLWDPIQHCSIPLQIISVDGVAVNIPANASPAEITASTGGGRFIPAPCPEGLLPPLNGAPPVCTSSILMMPSSRVEVLAAYRDCSVGGGGKLATVPAGGAAATFRTNSYTTGTIGQFWPAVNLANVTFTANGKGTNALVAGEATQILDSTAIASELQAENELYAPNPTCAPLAPGHIRRIFFGIPQNNQSAFGLAYEEIDENGQIVPGTMATQINEFDVMNPFICLPLGPNNTTTRERWQLVNLAQEIHNFHIHQVKFQLLGMDNVLGKFVPAGSKEGVMMDSIPLPFASGTCGSNSPDLSNPIEDYRLGLCRPQAVTVEIPFSIAGQFVYHCHILRHEDGGMMAFISVVPYA